MFVFVNGVRRYKNKSLSLCKIYQMSFQPQPKRKPSFSREKTAEPKSKTPSWPKNASAVKQEPKESATAKKETFIAKKNPESHLIVNEPMQLMAFLTDRLKDQSRTTIKSLLSNQQITIKKQVVRQFDYELKAGDEVVVHWGKGKETLKDPQLKIVYEDNDLIVVEKAAGLLSIATQKERIRTAYSILSEYVKKQHPANRIFVVHRLDRETSGLMLFAKNQDIQFSMQHNWRFAVSQRKYVAVVEGKLETGDGSGVGTIKSYLWESKALIVYSSQNPEDGQEAVTHYRVLNSNDNYSLIELELETGRKNQIRVQMNSIGYPLSGDLKYGGHPSSLKRLALHAHVLSFVHPATGQLHDFETAVPAAFVKLVEKGK
jgi:23S rRNA pseudouridine1911/1915/1917 synthase